MNKKPGADNNEIQVIADLTMRPECDDDLDFLQRLYASTRTREMALIDWKEEQKDNFLRSQFETQHSYYLAHFPESRFDVIEQAGLAIGRLYVASCPGEIRIIDITLLPEHRGQGLGRQILQVLLERAAATGKTVSLHVEKFNPALHLYERLGFKNRGADDGINLFMEWHGGPLSP